MSRHQSQRPLGEPNRRSASRLIPRPISSLVVSLALLGTMIACSIPVDGEVRALDADEYADVVYGLDTTTTTEPPEGEATPIRLFFINDEGLAWVRRPLLDTKIPEILDALQQGPSQEELVEDPGLRSGLPAGLNPSPRQRAEGEQTLIVDVDDAANLRTLPSDNPPLAESVFTQMVCTLTKLNLDVPITGVEFYDSGGRIPVPDTNRSLIDGPAQASDFNDCLTPAELLELQEGEDGTSTTTEE